MLVIGAASILVGGLIALTRDVLKQLLAYSTISQYGYVVFMFGLGGKYGAMGASFYVIAHALAKSALFLTAGAVTEATGENRLSRLGGLARSMPVLAVASGVTAAGLAAVPLTIGLLQGRVAIQRGPQGRVSVRRHGARGDGVDACLHLAFLERHLLGRREGRGKEHTGDARVPDRGAGGVGGARRNPIQTVRGVGAGRRRSLVRRADRGGPSQLSSGRPARERAGVVHLRARDAGDLVAAVVAGCGGPFCPDRGEGGAGANLPDRAQRVEQVLGRRPPRRGPGYAREGGGDPGAGGDTGRPRPHISPARPGSTGSAGSRRRTSR